MRYVILLILFAAPAFASFWGVGAAAGFAMPVGDYSEFAGASAIADVRVSYGLTPYLNLALTVPYRFGHAAKEPLRGANASYSIVPVLIGAAYRFEFLPLMPYAGGGAAAVVGTAKVPGDAGTEEYRSFRVGAYVGGGLEYYLGENYGVDTRGRFIAAFGGEAVTYEDRLVEADNYMSFGVTIGLFWYP